MTAIDFGARGPLQLRLVAGAVFGAAIGLAIGIISGEPSDALAASLCGTKPAVPPGGCQTNWICDSETGWWAPVYAADGTACNDGDSCTTNDVCDGSGACGGNPVCPPPVPGPLSGPTTTVTNGAYTLSWTASQAVTNVSSRFLDRYEVFENGAFLTSTAAWIVSSSISSRGDGTYRYNVRACNAAGCSAFNGNFFVTVLWPPGVPSSFNVPQDSGPNYTISWSPQPYGPPAPAGSGPSDRYDLNESTDGVTWPTNYSVTGTAKSITGKPQGSRFYYRVRACNASSCSAYTAAKSVDIVSALTTVTEQPPPTFTPPPQQWVGTIPATPSVEGGAATYRIPIEVPPGRAGMQPDIALTYSSRNGNGIAGVGWAVSGTRSIYRCPQTLAQDGMNKPVQYNLWNDRLCFDGQRLVLASGFYGISGSEYRTEVDQFDRIRLKNDNMSGWTSYFDVEHKSGRVSRFEAVWASATGSPDTWYLTREYDRQGNCIVYNYAPALPSADPERVLSQIVYTGSMSGDQCITGTDARILGFSYTNDREDRRTTYRFGALLRKSARLAAITTQVGNQPVRRYEMSYSGSVATRRSMLRQVTLCAGSTCGAEQLLPTQFQYQEQPQTFDYGQVQFNNQTLDGNWRASSAPDFDGDGTRDHVYDYFDPATGARTTYLDMTVCQTAATLVSPLDSSRKFRFDNPLAPTINFQSFGFSEDFNSDGKADLIGSRVINGTRFMTFEAVKACNVFGNEVLTNFATDSPGGPLSLVTPIDYDGDGIIDLKYWQSGPWIKRRRTRDLTDWSAANVDTFAAPAPPNTSMSTQMERDLNGDGFVDTAFDTAPGVGVGQPTWIAFYNGPQSGGYVYWTLQNLGGPQGAFSDYPQRRWIDVNGDGLPDIYEPGSVWVNQGGVPRSTMFKQVPVVMPPSSIPADPANNASRAKHAFAMDFDADGQEELIVPNTRTISYCGGDMHSTLPSGDPAWFCGDEFDTAPASWRAYDHSVFRWNAYKFVESSDGQSYTLVLQSDVSNLQAPIATAVGTNPVDWNGDGMTDVRSHLTNGLNGNGYSLPAQQLGPYVSRGQSPAPDLLTGATNGLGETASWIHQPLSLPPQLQATATGCDMPEPFYVSHPDAPRSQGYAFFTSAMWTVARFDVSNGIGAGKNKTCYRYQDAMLNNEGRGFQGFKVITAEEQMPRAEGEPSTTVAGCGGTCSVNNLRTRTEFNQEFPLTSKVQRVTVALASSPLANEKILSTTTYWWHAEKPQTSFGGWVVYSPASIESKFDLPQPNGAMPLLSEARSASEVDVVSGETTRSCVLVGGQTPVPSSASQPRPGVATGVIKVDTREFASNDTVNWWLGKLNSRTTLSDFFTTTFTLNPNCLVTGTATQACSAAPPTCPTVTQSGDAKVQTANYTWYPDGLFTPTARKVKTEALVAGGVAEATSTFTYGDFGNLATKSVNARNVTADPVTTYAYTTDGYFVTRQTNPAGHVSYVETDPKTGLVTKRQEVQNGPMTTTSYDFLGRVLDVTTDGMRTIAHRMSTCAVGDCVMKRQVIQQGAPTKTEYFDRLGRTVATGLESFPTTTGTSFEILAKVTYNARGTKTAEYQPWKSGALAGGWDGISASPYSTQYSGIDALGRVGTKTVTRGAIFETGRGEPTLTTTYTYAPAESGNGLKTVIAVNRPVSQGGSINMSRTYDRRGKLIETTQDISTPSPHTITASYFYDPAGNLTLIADSAATTPNKLTATYDNLGRKTSVVDPDRGTWTYTWDGLGRVQTQTDSKGIVVSYKYDGIGRMQQRFVKTSNDPSPVLESTWQYDLNGKFGTVGAMIGNENFGAGADNFRRDYLYDPLLRPFRVTTHIPAGTGWSARDFAVEYGYDHAYGRLKGMSFPGPDVNTPGEMVALDYDSRGNLLGETALTTPTTRAATSYRIVGDMSVRGQVSFQTLGNGIKELAQYDDSTGLAMLMKAYDLADQPPTPCTKTRQYLVRQVDYTYDHYLNLAKQAKQLLLRNGTAIQFSGCTEQGATATETYQYDDLQRLSSESRNWLAMPPPPGQAADLYEYDDLGNITKKDDYADLYTYGHGITVDGAGPHAVKSVTTAGVTTATFTYDPNGNLFGGDGRTITFDSLDRPITVTRAGITTNFRYAPDGSRYLQRTIGSSPGPKTVYYVDKDYERIDWTMPDQTIVTEEKTYVGPSVAVYRRSGIRDVRYLHLDRLGSTNAVTDGGGFEVLADSHDFDAYGRPRGREFQSSSDKLHPGGDYNVTTEHGFTKHEHLDDTYLIHMNGRVYDYRLGRFLSVDPVISNPASSQSINSYSYIGNNPLSGVDPTGYEPLPLTGLFVGVAGNGASPHVGAPGASADQAGGPSDAAQGPSRLSPFAVMAGIAFGTAQGVTPGGAFLASPASDNFSFALGQAVGLSATSGAQIIAGTIGMVAGGGEAALSVASTPVTGPLGVAAAVAGGAIATEGAATAAIGISNIGPAVKAWSSVMEMRGSGNGTEGGGGNGNAAKEGVYEFKGKSGKDYVGQSKDIDRRLSEHTRSGKLPAENGGTTRRTEVQGGKTTREVAEQRRINDKGGLKNTENKVNPIGPKRQHLMENQSKLPDSGE